MFVVFCSEHKVDRPKLIQQDSRAVKLAKSLSRSDNNTRKDNLGTVWCRHCGRGGMVDTPDLKSVGRMPVGVRVPPPAPSCPNN